MKENIENDIQQLEEICVEKKHTQSLNRLANSAKAGASIKWWGNRVLFGNNLANSIEKWLNTFEPKTQKPLIEQIPTTETKEVIAAWVQFSYKRTAIIFLLSSLLTIVTGFFLYNQIRKQEKLINVQIQKNELENEFLFTQILYDEKCDIYKSKRRCLPKHNRRQREDAVKRLSKTSKNLFRAELGYTQLPKIDLSDVNLKQARIKTQTSKKLT